MDQCPFKFEDLDRFFITNDQSVSKDRLIEILNKIAETPQGEQLLHVLKTVLDKKDKKISFSYAADFAFQSEQTIRGQNEKEIKITIQKEPEPVTRFAFDGQKLVERPIGNKNLESYLISHELVHVISFLESNVMSGPNPERAWNKRKMDWESFLSTPRMKPIYDKVVKNLQPIRGRVLNLFLSRNQKIQQNQTLKEQVKEAFITLFKTTEEARNILGYVTETDKSLIGEYCFFNAGDKTLLPVYNGELMFHGVERSLNNAETTLLNVMAKEFGINLQVSRS